MADDNIQYDDAYQYLDDKAQQVADEVLKVCMVYDSDDFFTVFVQIFLAAAALMSLWIKRQNEIPKRKFKTWFLDCSKQGIGAVYAHVCNMVRIVSRLGSGPIGLIFSLRHDTTICKASSHNDPFLNNDTIFSLLPQLL